MSYSYFFNNGSISQNGCIQYETNQIKMNQIDCSGTFIFIPNGDAQLNISSINAFSSFKIISSSLVNRIWNISVTVIKDDIRIQTRTDHIFVKIDIDKSTDNFSELNDIVITNPQNGDILSYDDNLNKFVNAPPVGVSTDNTTILGNGTANSALTVSPRVFPYYYPQYRYGGTYSHALPPSPGDGFFFYEPTYNELLISYTDNSGVSHENEMKKLDYSSTIHIYNDDKTLKNRYIFTQSSLSNPGYIIILCDDSNVNIEFTFTSLETYSFEFIYSTVQDLEDLRNINVSAPVNNQVLSYSDGFWINKTLSTTAKSMMTVGWYNNVPENYFVDTNYYFPYSPYGVTLSLIGTSFTQVAAINIANMLASDLGTNKCGIKNISGGTKQFLVMGKVSGAITNQTWVGFGLNDKFAVQIRQSRCNSVCLTNDTLAINFHCIVDIPNQDGVYIVGCTHANYDVRFNLFNIWLTVIEI